MFLLDGSLNGPRGTQYCKVTAVKSARMINLNNQLTTIVNEGVVITENRELQRCFFLLCARQGIFEDTDGKVNQLAAMHKLNN